MSAEQGKSNTARHKERTGLVIGNKPDKTIIVLVKRRVEHPRYRKVVTQSQKYYVHDEGNTAHVGDTVKIRETRPMSKMKRWRLLDVVRRAAIEGDGA